MHDDETRRRDPEARPPRDEGERAIGDAGLDSIDQGLTVGGGDAARIRDAELTIPEDRGDREPGIDPFEPGVGEGPSDGEGEDPKLAKWTADRNAASGGWSGTSDVVMDDLEVEALRQGQGTEPPDEGAEL